jgi:hypothetical protein
VAAVALVELGNRSQKSVFYDITELYIKPSIIGLKAGLVRYYVVLNFYRYPEVGNILQNVTAFNIINIDM